MYFLLLQEVADAILQAFRTIFGLLCDPIYNLIDTFYNLFDKLARIEAVKPGAINDVYRKVGLILGVFMVFKLSFTLITSLIDPEKFKDTKNGYGKLAARCVISIVLFGITPFVFREAITIQNLIIGNDGDTSNFLYRLIVEDNSSIASENFGRKLSSELFFAFYKKNENAIWEESAGLDGDTLIRGDSYDNLKLKTETGEIGYSNLIRNLTLSDVNGQYFIEYDGFLCFVVGCFAVYLLLSFCIEISVRVFQLAFLQLIAPIPILSYISDPDGMFKKWLKQCTTTYMELFIRLSIIYFVIYMSNYIMDNKQFIINVEEGGWLEFVIEIFLILGMFLFAKKAPSLIKELFPSSKNAASFDFGNKEAKKMLSFGAGAVTGGIAGMTTGIRYGNGAYGKNALIGRLGGAVTGLGRGLRNGAKTNGKVIANTKSAIEKQRSAMMKAYDRNHDGSNFRGRHFTAYEDQRKLEAFDKEIEAYKNYDNVMDQINTELEKDTNVKLAMAEEKAMYDAVAKGQKYKGRTISATDLNRAKANVKALKDVALANGMRTHNVDIERLLKEAENVRSKGKEKGYNGFGNNSITDTSRTESQRIASLYGNKTHARAETHKIEDQSGSRHKAYKQAKANAKYAKK